MKSLRQSENGDRPIVRLILEATCPICGVLPNVPPDGIFAVIAAQDHTAETAHVVILSGTTDSPEIADDPPLATAVIPAKWGQA